MPKAHIASFTPVSSTVGANRATSHLVPAFQLRVPITQREHEHEDTPTR